MGEKTHGNNNNDAYYIDKNNLNNNNNNNNNAAQCIQVHEKGINFAVMVACIDTTNSRSNVTSRTEFGQQMLVPDAILFEFGPFLRNSTRV